MTRIARHVPGTERRRNKFSAVRTICAQGHEHPSGKEARTCDELHLRQRAGEISHLELHPKFPLIIDGEPVLIRSKGFPNGRKSVYRADFAFNDHCEKPPRRRVLDSKGFDDDRGRLKRAVAECIYRMRVELI